MTEEQQASQKKSNVFDDKTIVLSALEAQELGLLKQSDKPRKLCSGLRYDLKRCLLDTDCCKVERRLPRECLKDPSCPSECKSLANEFFECKRQFIDMRKRFRGNRGY